MISDLVKQLPFKYSVWILATLFSVTVGYWLARLHSLDVDPSVLEFNVVSVATAVSKCWVILFHLAFTFIALRDRASADAQFDTAQSAVIGSQSRLAELGVEDLNLELFLKHLEAGGITFEAPPEVEADRDPHFHALLNDLDQASAPLDNARLKVAARVPRQAMKQAASLLRQAKAVWERGDMLEVLDLIGQSEAAISTYESATKETKVQRVLGWTVTALFLTLIAYWLYTESWANLTPIAVGIGLGWLLAASQQMSGLYGKVYYPYVVAIALLISSSVYGALGHSKHTPPLATVELLSGGEITGGLLFRGEKQVVLKDADGSIHYVASDQVAVLKVVAG